MTSAVTNSTGALTANRIILGNGGSDIKAMSSAGTSVTVLHGNAAGAPTFGAVSLTADVSGTLPYANGGTGATSFTNHGAVVAGATALSTVAPGTSGNVLTSNGTDWTSAAEGHLGTVTSVALSGQNGVNIISGSPITTSGTILVGIGKSGTDVTFTQNSVTSFTSVDSGAVANTLVLKAGKVGAGQATPTSVLHSYGSAGADAGGLSLEVSNGLTRTKSQIYTGVDPQNSSTNALFVAPQTSGRLYLIVQEVRGATGAIIKEYATNSFQFGQATNSVLVGNTQTFEVRTDVANTAIFYGGRSLDSIIRPYSSSFNVQLAPDGGKTIIGSAVNTTLGNANSLQIPGTTAATNSLGISAWSADALGARVELGKSRGAAIGTNTIVTSGDVLGTVVAYGANGTGFEPACAIVMKSGGTPGASGDMPGQMLLQTVPDGSATLITAVTINQDQSVVAAATLSATNLSAWASFTTTRTGWTDVLAPTVTARYCQVRNVCHFSIKVVPGTTVATTAGTSYCSLPLTAAGIGGDGSMVDTTTLLSIGSCVIDVANSRVYVPTQVATGDTITINGWYEV